MIATGPPSTVHFAAALLKLDLPDINLIQDYRDPWNSRPEHHYKKGCLDMTRKEKIAWMEDFSTLHADRILVVSKNMEANLKSSNSFSKEKVLTLHNGFDKEDFKNLSSNANENDFIFVYAGAISSARREGIILIAEAISKIEDDFIKNNIHLNIYCNRPYKYFTGFGFEDILKKYFSFLPFQSKDEIASLINKHSFCLSINPKLEAHAFGTKIFDYMAFNKTILHLSNGGELFDILKENGEVVTDYNVENAIKALLEIKEISLKKKKKESSFSQFDIKNLTLHLEKIFI